MLLKRAFHINLILVLISIFTTGSVVEPVHAESAGLLIDKAENQYVNGEKVSARQTLKEAARFYPEQRDRIVAKQLEYAEEAATFGNWLDAYYWVYDAYYFCNDPRLCSKTGELALIVKYHINNSEFEKYLSSIAVRYKGRAEFDGFIMEIKGDDHYRIEFTTDDPVNLGIKIKKGQKCIFGYDKDSEDDFLYIKNVSGAQNFSAIPPNIEVTFAISKASVFKYRQGKIVDMKFFY